MTAAAALRTRPRLVVDVAPLMEDQWTGIPVFTRRLVSALEASGRIDVDYAVDLMRVPADWVRAAIGLGSGTFLRTEVQRTGAERRPVDPAVPVLYPSVKKLCGFGEREASTVHDMSTLFMPENHDDANVAHHLDGLHDELATNDVVFCVSEATREALVSAVPHVANKCSVLYQYVDWPDEFAAIDRNLPPVAIGDYVVVIGTVEPRKNLGLIIRSLEELARHDRTTKFVVIGKKGWLVDDFLASIPPEVRSRVVFTGFVSEFVKYRLLRHCRFMVFPSIYEGFGIPALEAMSVGKPVLASRTSSFPEVIGEAGVYFDPLSIQSFVSAFVEMSAATEQYAGRTAERCRRFGPQTMARPVLEWLGQR